MLTRQEQLVKRLTQSGEKTIAFFESLSDEVLRQQVYTQATSTAPKWTLFDILAHFVSTERIFQQYGNDILAGGPGAPDDFDIDAFNSREVTALTAQHNRNALVAAFRQARHDTITLAQRTTNADLDCTGYHPWFGEMQLEKMIKLVYRHNQIHERDIKKALQTGRPVPHVDVTAPTAQQNHNMAL